MNNKKEQLAEFHRHNIMKASRILFHKKGMEQTTMDDIAKASIYSKSTIYVYFKSKEEIHYYLLLEYMNLMKEELLNATQSTEDFTKCYYQICKILVVFYEKHSLYFDSMLREISITEAAFEKLPILKQIYQTGESINEIILSFIEKGINRRELKSDIKALPSSFTLWASLCGVISLAHKKESYIRQRMKMSKSDFLQYSFELLFQSVSERTSL